MTTNLEVEKKSIIEDEEYQALEDDVIDFIEVVNTRDFQRIYNFILAKKAECYRPAINVDKKELDRIHANHDLICEILDEIPSPIKDLDNFISSNKGTLFDVGEIKTFYKWNNKTGIVETVTNNRVTVEISTPNGTTVTTTPEKIQALAKKVIYGK